MSDNTKNDTKIPELLSGENRVPLELINDDELQDMSMSEIELETRSNVVTLNITTSLLQGETERLDKLLMHEIAKELDNFSREHIQRLIKEGNVTVNGSVVLKPNHILRDTVEIEVTYSQRHREYDLTPRDMDLFVVYEDEHILVVDKQAGLTVHPGNGTHDDTLVHGLLYRYQQNLSSINGLERPGIVHRLDRDTSGLMVVAKNDFAHVSLAKQMEAKTAQRYYKAFIWGIPKIRNTTITTQIQRSKYDRTKMSVVEHGGKVAITHYEVVDIFNNGTISMVECKLHTGRTHQIRVHMNHIGHSVIGDNIYGNNSRKSIKYSNKKDDSIYKIERQALHAYYLSFTHPHTNNVVEFFSELPNDMQQLLSSLKKL